MADRDERLKEELEENQNVEDDALDAEEPGNIRYDITSYGIDFDVDGLVRRLQRGDIFIPRFQRSFVWTLKESSRLVESLLLGLPVPGIFLAQEHDSGKLLVIDGQQRLLSLRYFMEGVFNPTEGNTSQRVFRLRSVSPKFDKKTFSELESKDQLAIENSVIHATVVKQDTPSDDDTSIYHIFERLNSGGKKLSSQEIRTAVYHGDLIELVGELNDYPSWRQIYGRTSNRMKDRELILRYFALLDNGVNYQSPMTDFISMFVKRNRNNHTEKLESYSRLFRECCDLFVASLSSPPFRRSSALNVATFDAAMIGLTELLKRDGHVDKQVIERSYKAFTADDEFIELTTHTTGDRLRLLKRIEMAKAVFLGV